MKQRDSLRRVVHAIFLSWLSVLFFVSCAPLPISEDGLWTGPLPDEISVKEAARIQRPWYGRGLAPFLLTLFAGSRTGLEWNEGRNVRATELIRSLPYVGLVVVPYWCYEALSEQTMQSVANESGIDENRQRKYEAIVKRLVQDGRTEEAEYLGSHSPFDPNNHPPDPAARMPEGSLDGFWNNMKIGYVELLIGHREALERNESRGLRTLEYWHPLYVTRIWEAFQAASGDRMEDIAEDEHLDETWLPKDSLASAAGV